MKSLFLAALVFLFASCDTAGVSRLPSLKQIEEKIGKGEFTEASKLIKIKLLDDFLSGSDRWDLNFRLEQMERIRRDFTQRDSSVINYIKKFYPGVTKEEIADWEKSNALENMVIDGTKFYFHSAGRNLFRIDSVAAKHYNAANQGMSDSLNRFLDKHIPELIARSEKSEDPLFTEVRMNIRYTLTVKAGEVPPGEIVRVWLPFPRGDVSSHKNIELLSVSQPEYIISPDSYFHKSIYMESTAKIDEPVVFGYELSYSSFANYFDSEKFNPRPYDTESRLYAEFTSEETPHILFSDELKRVTSEVVGNETDPYKKVKLIFEWIDSNFPWASAREYSTIENIPGYVLKNRHGDCGQVSLLFITMARIAGIPAKWQSGWMMHPGNVNLHDWAEVYFEGIGWVPVDQSFGRTKGCKDQSKAFYFYTSGLDPYRLIVNQGTGRPLFPAKIHPRSETVDFQRGEVEWRGENLYFNRWNYNMEVEYLK